jgi:hypothetical protein
MRAVTLALVAAVLAFAPSAAAAQDMPDPSLIHGRAIPAPELPDGTVTVRVVREAIGNNVAGQPVDLIVGNATRTAKTDELGRAEFPNLPSGEARARSTVDGEALESQPFPVPATGGLRIILVAGIARAEARKKLEAEAAAAAPAVPGTVVLGENSRVIMEFNNDQLTAFYILEFVNNARNRVDVGQPLVIDLPAIATGASAMEGSSPQATVNGTRVTVTGPFAAGTTNVQVAFRLPTTSSEMDFVQRWPVPLQQVIVGVEKFGGLAISSPQFTQTREVPTENGTVYALGTGEALAANTPLTVKISNLPVRSNTPKYAAIALVVLIAGVGVWLSATAKRGRLDRGALIRRRDELLRELERLENQRRTSGAAGERYASQRQRVLAELEQIYGELDDAGSGPRGGGEGIAA